MKNFIQSLLAALCMCFAIAGTASAQDAVRGPALDADKDYYTVMSTTKGEMVIKMFGEDAPVTVQNFVNLVEGTKPWKNPKTGKTEKRPFYDGLTFHRIIKGFMIQGGCPLGTGTGDGGYKFKDEFQSGRTFNSDPYLLAMANSGPNTNGTQFFITDKGSQPAHLTNKHTIFGQVVAGRDVVDAIAAAPKGAQDRPNPPVVIEKAIVVRLPKGTAWSDDAKKAAIAAQATEAAKAAEAAVEAAPAKTPEATPAATPAPAAATPAPASM